MITSRNSIKQSIALLSFLLVSTALPRRINAQRVPVTGAPVAEFANLDRVLMAFGGEIGCQAITIAISKDNELVYSRGYGWQDELRRRPTQPNALMRIASVTKPITAACVKKLIRDNELAIDSSVLDLLQVRSNDPRMTQITVSHLLKHEGGWDSKLSYDPMFKTREIERFLNLRRQAQPVDVIAYMLKQPLQFNPGERSAYSNFGYCILGRVIEKASGLSYEQFVRNELFGPLSTRDIGLSRNLPQNRGPREVSYPNNKVIVEVMDSHGGLAASAPALCKFLEAFWIDGEPRKHAQKSNFTFFGSLPGTTAMVRQRIDGYNVAILCNGRREDTYPDDDKRLKALVDTFFDDAVLP
jgi:CubicO group peptidase (beta-lactamase class C family)